MTLDSFPVILNGIVPPVGRPEERCIKAVFCPTTTCKANKHCHQRSSLFLSINDESVLISDFQMLECIVLPRWTFTCIYRCTIYLYSVTLQIILCNILLTGCRSSPHLCRCVAHPNLWRLHEANHRHVHPRACRYCCWHRCVGPFHCPTGMLWDM